MADLNGFINLNKPLGRTSSDFVVYVRKRLPRGTAIGHGGTLDPEASGVLPLCVGAATRLFDFIIDKQKTYLAELQLGAETDTQDATGQIIREAPVTAGEAEIQSALPAFIGEIEQIPPMFSAVKKDGKRLYQLARRGETIERAARRCVVDGIELVGQTGENRYRLRVTCRKGVYIRTLCHDLGLALGCGGHMASLTRESAGAFRLSDALTPDALDALAQNGALEKALLPMDFPLMHLPAARVDRRYAHAIRNGNPLPVGALGIPLPPGEIARLYLEDEFAGILEGREGDLARFRCMLLRAESK